MTRLASLDAFRGFAIASMVLVNNPGDWGHIYPPLAHAEWNGWTFTDLVFPFFLFAVGVAMAISIDRRVHAGDSPVVLAKSLVRRAIVIFLVGLVLNLIPAFDFGTVRIPGVLQRIALCIVIATPFAIYASTRAVVAGILALLAAYTVPMLLVGDLEPGRDFGASVDRAVLGGHLWPKSRTWDPEGLVSTIPAAASLLFGLIAGRWLLTAPADFRSSVRLFAAGIAALVAGLALDTLLMPINKNLWTTSYCVFMTGWSLVAFALFHATMDGTAAETLRASARRAMMPLTIFGMNALFIFALSGLIGRLLAIPVDGTLTTKARLYAPLKALAIAPENASLLFALGFELAMFAVAWVMWKKRWFVKA